MSSISWGQSMENKPEIPEARAHIATGRRYWWEHVLLHDSGAFIAAPEVKSCA
jgi:hypothetical protein